MTKNLQKLAKKDDLQHSNFDHLQISSNPELLMELKTKSTDSNILSCALSPDCSLIGFSCYKSLHLLSMQIEYLGLQESNKIGGKKYNVKLKKLTVPEDVEETSIQVMAFDQTSTKLILADNKHFLVHVLDCSNPTDIQMVTSFVTNAVADSDVKNDHCAINMMAVSPSNKYLAVSQYNNFVQIFDMENWKVKFFKN